MSRSRINEEKSKRLIIIFVIAASLFLFAFAWTTFEISVFLHSRTLNTENLSRVQLLTTVAKDNLYEKNSSYYQAVRTLQLLCSSSAAEESVLVDFVSQEMVLNDFSWLVAICEEKKCWSFSESGYNPVSFTFDPSFLNSDGKVEISNGLCWYFCPVKGDARLEGKKILGLAFAFSLDQVLFDVSTIGAENYSLYMIDSEGKCCNTVVSVDGVPTKVSNSALFFDAFRHSRITKVMSDATTLTNAYRLKVPFLGLINLDGKEKYFFLEPLRIFNETFFLLHLVSEDSFSGLSKIFAKHVVKLALLIIFLMAVCTFLFLILYRSRKQRQFSKKEENIRSEHNNQLVQALQLANQASAAKTAFLSNMSHEIRTPMNSIIHMSDFALEALDEKDAEKAKEYMEYVKSSSLYLNQLVNKVLDMSRIESGKVILKYNPENLRNILYETVNIIQPMCIAKNISLQLDFMVLSNRKILCDKIQLKEILINLLNNAIKFTEPGGRIIFAAKEMTSKEAAAMGKGRKMFCQFSVEDTGCGIPEDKLKTIFEPYIRADEADRKHVEGSGLGLAITKSIVDAMDGTISVKSLINSGSKFTVDLSFDIVTDKKMELEQAESGKKNPVPESAGRVLLAEDNQLNRIIAAKLLEEFKFTVDFAENGKIAVQKFLESEPSYYAMIFMDIQMPEMDGYEATKAIRASSHKDALSVPIIAMTAFSFDNEVDRCLKAGMNGHLGKPLEPDQLARIVDSFSKTINQPS